MRQGFAAVLVTIAVHGSIATTAENQTYRVDPDKSHATIHVGKVGAFSFIAGHTHEVTGPSKVALLMSISKRQPDHASGS